MGTREEMILQLADCHNARMREAMQYKAKVAALELQILGLEAARVLDKFRFGVQTGEIEITRR